MQPTSLEGRDRECVKPVHRYKRDTGQLIHIRLATGPVIPWDWGNMHDIERGKKDESGLCREFSIVRPVTVRVQWG